MNTLAPPYPDHTRTIENITQQRGTSVIGISRGILYSCEIDFSDLPLKKEN